jgi:hypothetical protein
MGEESDDDTYQPANPILEEKTKDLVVGLGHGAANSQLVLWSNKEQMESASCEEVRLSLPSKMSNGNEKEERKFSFEQT